MSSPRSESLNKVDLQDCCPGNCESGISTGISNSNLCDINILTVSRKQYIGMYEKNPKKGNRHIAAADGNVPVSFFKKYDTLSSVTTILLYI